MSETEGGSRQAQSLSVKRAEVEFHKFASLGEPERAMRGYAEENHRRRGLLVKHLNFVGPMSPFLEIGANAGHSSYMLANEFGADGFALDISADALRYGRVLQDKWGLARAPVRIAGDALNLPFRDGSIRLVMAFQMLSQFMNIESVFLEVKRILAPGGVFYFGEEPLRRVLTLRLCRLPYYEQMKPWERRLYDCGLLSFIATDVIGAEQEESFGIRQNHSMNLKDWHRLVEKHFVEHRYEMFVPARGWAEGAVKKLAVRLDPHRSVWRAGRLLGGTFTAFCRKAGDPQPQTDGWQDRFESLLRCPDCHGPLSRNDDDVLACACGYQSASQAGVYNLLRSSDRKELYPGDREDIIDFSTPEHENRLLDGWHRVEGVYGNRYRWLGPRASARLVRLSPRPQRLRIRGHAEERCFAQGEPVRIEVLANGSKAGGWVLKRMGMFILETDLPEAAEYKIEIHASPVWQAPPDDRPLTVNMSMIRLVDRD
jgi:ubiquinone/menaquinone biosynthesis C-methylase UbiE